MIQLDEVFKIGKFVKPHGLKGEIALQFDNDVFDKTDCPYLVCMMNGILVPFFIKEYRFKGNDIALITFEDILTEKQARIFNNIEVYFPRKYFDPENQEIDFNLDYFIGFSVQDELKGKIGKIIDINESTINTLFLLEDTSGNEHIIPASDDFITEVDEKNKILYMNLPIGLIEE